jgi:predicted dehydrogenase
MKALFCGLGSIGQRHLRNLRSLLGDDVEVLAWRQRGGGPVLGADMKVRDGITIEEAYRVTPFTDLESALAQRPDICFITNPNTLHLHTAWAAAQSGCHLFIEKPVSHSLHGMSQLIREVETRRLTAFVAYQFRFHPGLQRLKRAVEAGTLGSLTHAHIVNAEYLPAWHPWEDYRDTHPARRELGGGCLRIQTHELDYALWLFGMPRRVFAMGGRLSRLETDVEDSVDLLLECVHAGRPFPVHLHLDYLQMPPQRVCEVVGDLGKAHYDYYAARVDVHQTEGRTVETTDFSGFDRNEMFMAELRHFLACVSGEETPLIDLREGLRSMQIAEAAYRSMETGAAVSVGEADIED